VPSVDPLQALIDQYGAEKILSVCGNIPVTPDEIAQARKKLENPTQ
jgi:hypothetical protein